ncbi:hypothetical protein [Zobellella sp. DQSA1]|uniref:hypothetical protein n=1 Tax=Zobellella sp. DQSA1 TaxID=3342386 RepID=UPI0035C0AC78
MNTLLKTSALAATMALVLGGAAPAQAAKVVKNLELPATMELTIEGDCSNSPGPNITLGPVITLHNVPITVLFSGGNGNHTAEVEESVDLVLELAGEIVLPKQPVFGGATGNPDVSVYVNGALLFGPIKCKKL